MSADRDRILEQALKHELRGDAATTPHIDAETFAAWQDDALDAAQMADVELHVSTCPRCQELLAAFGRGTVAPTPQPAAEVPRFQWWKWWLAPLAAGAAAVTLWMVVPEQQQLATAPPTPSSSVAVDKVQPTVVEEKKADAPATLTAAAEPEKRAREADNFKENKLTAEASRDDRQQLKDQAVAAPKQEIAMAQPTAAAPPAAAAAPQAPPPAVAREELAGLRAAGELQKSARLAFAPIEVPTLDRNVRWRIAGNRIERTDNAGQTWTSKREQTTDGIAAGSAPSSSVAWFAGRAGLVLLTGDAGTTFTEVSLAEPLDIASISATDVRTAIISTVSGRRFRTDDAGLTWRPF